MGVVFFFSSRRRHTRYWRDWSSDVCSSDLEQLSVTVRPLPTTRRGGRKEVEGARAGAARRRRPSGPGRRARRAGGSGRGAGGGRKSVGMGKRVDLGGRRIIKKKKCWSSPHG